jgi:hypothetical protein
MQSGKIVLVVGPWPPHVLNLKGLQLGKLLQAQKRRKPHLV